MIAMLDGLMEGLLKNMEKTRRLIYGESGWGGSAGTNDDDSDKDYEDDVDDCSGKL